MAAAAVLLLGGCYTVLKHPQTDLAQSHGDYQDCASCHSPGYGEPLYGDPYAYNGDVWWGYYGCPWWIEDCGSAYAGTGGGSVSTEGRSTGSFGIPARTGATAPPMITPGRGPGGVAPAAGENQPESKQTDRKTKKPRDDGAEDTGSKKDPEKDRDDPARDDDPEGDPP